MNKNYDYPYIPAGKIIPTSASRDGLTFQDASGRIRTFDLDTPDFTWEWD